MVRRWCSYAVVAVVAVLCGKTLAQEIEATLVQELEGGLNASRHHYCQGVSTTIVLSTSRNVTHCRFSLFNGTESVVEVERVDDSLQCKLPPVATLRAKLEGLAVVLAGGAEAAVTWTSLDGRHLSEPKFEACVEFLSHKAEEYCVGTIAGVAIEGATLPALINLVDPSQVDCRFEDGKTTSTFVDRRSNVILCNAPPWKPWSEVERSVANLSTITLRFGQVANYSSSLPPGVVCLEVASHEVEFSPFAVEDQVPCAPFCCKREAVSIVFTGGTVAPLREQPSRLRCVFHPFDEDQRALVSTVSFPSNSQVRCDPVQGWRPGEGTGNYKSVALQVLDSSLTRVEIELAAFQYSPASASRTCIRFDTMDGVCILNQKQEVMFSGPTVRGFLAYIEEQRIDLENVTACLTDNSSTLVRPTRVNSSLQCTFSREFITLGQLDPKVFELKVDLPEVDPILATDNGVTVESCIQDIEATRFCPKNDSNFTSVWFQTNETATATVFYCELTVAGQAERRQVIAAVERTQHRFVCVNDTDDAFDFVRVSLFQEKPKPFEYLSETTIHLNASCTDTSVGDAGTPTVPLVTPFPVSIGQDSSFGFGIIVIIVVIVFLSIVSALLCVYCRKRAEKKQRKSEPDYSHLDPPATIERSTIDTGYHAYGDCQTLQANTVKQETQGTALGLQ